jgi:hypothetical protein
MGRLSKDAWSTSSLRTKEVEVPQLGGTVLIRELPATITAELKGLTDIVQIGEEQRAKFDVAAMERRQFAYGVIGDSGEPLFSEDEVEELRAKHGAAFQLVIDAIDALSGIDKESFEEAEARFPGGRNGAVDSGEAQLLEGAAGDGGPDLPARTGAGAAHASEGDV